MSAYSYRRGSIFWALTLIAVGGIFLYQNFNPAVHPWQIIARFWPILIIFWGLSKLIDYVQAQSHPETVPPSLFSGSEVVLLVLVLIMGSLISKVVLRSNEMWPRGWGINADDDFADIFLNSYSYTQTVSSPCRPQPRLVLANPRGDIEIHPAEQANAATLEAVVKETVRAENVEAARKISQQLKMEIVEEAGQYVVKSNLDSVPPGRAGEGLVVLSRSVRLDIILRVPKGTTTEITTDRGDITLGGLDGDQNLTAFHGDVHVSGTNGLVRVHETGGSAEIRDVKGNVEVDGRGRDVEVSRVTGAATVSGDFSGDVQFQDIAQTLRYNSSRTDLTAQKLVGRLDMEMGSLDANNVDGPFEISTRQKDITLDDFKHRVKISNTNGDIRLSTTAPLKQPIEVDLKKGEIELDLPATSSFEIDATSRHGEVESDFSGPNLKVNREGDAPSITGAYGKGGPRIHLSTAYGIIRLARAGQRQPPAPAAPSSTSSGEEKRTALRLQRHRFSCAALRRSFHSPTWMARKTVIN